MCLYGDLGPQKNEQVSDRSRGQRHGSGEREDVQEAGRAHSGPPHASRSGSRPQHQLLSREVRRVPKIAAVPVVGGQPRSTVALARSPPTPTPQWVATEGEEPEANVWPTDTLRVGTQSRGRRNSTPGTRAGSRTKALETWEISVAHSRETVPTPVQEKSVTPATATEEEAGACKASEMTGAQIRAHSRIVAPARGGTGG